MTAAPHDWVCLPGTLCTPEVFSPVLDALGVDAARRRHLMIETPELAALGAPLRAAVRPGDVVCGFSLGAIALAHNLGALQGARAVVLLAVNPLADTPDTRLRRHAARDRVLAGDARGWVTDDWHSMSTAPAGSPVQEQVIAMAEALAPLIPAQAELAIGRPDARNALATSDLPLIFVTGAQDRLTPPDPLPPVAARAAKAHLSLLDGLGHFALLEDPARVAQAIQEGFDALKL